MSFDPKQASYRRLRDEYSERTKSIAFWVGSGLSRPAGLPLWGELRDNLIADFRSDFRNRDEPQRSRLIERLDAIAHEKNLWVTFERLKRLSARNYESAIREHLDPDRRGRMHALPAALEAIWQLRISGVLTLNLDQLVTRAHSRIRPGSGVNEMLGLSAARSIALLRSVKPFIINLHGVVGDVSSWVLTHSDLETLLASDEYNAFIKTVFASQTVIFSGISAEDVSVGGFLRQLKHATDPGSHYWITDRGDAAATRWAEEVGVEIIGYKSEDGSHKELLEILNGLQRYRPHDNRSQPFVPDREQLALAYGAEVPPISELLAEPPETIRGILNAHAVSVLGDDSMDQAARWEKYRIFQGKYRRAIHAAWYYDIDSPAESTVFGYELQEEIGQGGFGHVYRARGSDGRAYAVKVLRPEVFEDAEKLGSFRRGVESMRILARRGIEGMVEWKAAFEMPAAVVMEFVPGVNLGRAIAERNLRSEERLRIALTLARILRAAHTIPERVLHRDLRPANVMLRDFFSNLGSWEVLLLDFDLSWHRDARERSIQISGAGALAYAAPEQLGISNATTRSALVDSFGLGMTLFNLFSQREPEIGEYQREDWSKRVMNECGSGLHGSPWQSVSPRVARLIVACTRLHQHHRWDMTQVLRELERLYEAFSAPDQVSSAELWAEELAARAFNLEYDWDVDRSMAQAVLPGGMVVSLSGDEGRGMVNASATWTHAGSTERRQIGKYLPNAVQRAADAFRKAGWRDVESTCNPGGSASVLGSIPVNDVPDADSRLTEAIRTAVRCFDFS